MRILVLRHVEKNSMDDVFQQTDYSKYEWIKATNVGNKLWLLGLISTISTPENHIDFLESYMSADYINQNYDICIKPEANIFSSRFIDGMKSHVDRYKDVKIPIYVIACGAAAKDYDELDDLCAAIREPATAFIKSIYKTGGEFCLRGHFTKSMFDRFGFHDAVVTGCPSLFQMGRNLHVPTEKVSPSAFHAVLNGSIDLVKHSMKQHPDSVFIDQGMFYPMLYSNEHSPNVKSCVKLYGTYGLRLLHEDRVKLWIDLQDWADYLLTQNFSFSCGSRIHGNILPILCGIPATICPPDARVREMAEFYEIPMVSKTELQKRDLYDIYSDTDYGSFNQNFAAKFDAYERFMKEHGIVRALNCDPMLRTDLSTANSSRLAEVQCLINRKRIDATFMSVSRNPAWLVYETARHSSIKAIEAFHQLKTSRKH